MAGAMQHCASGAVSVIHFADVLRDSGESDSCVQRSACLETSVAAVRAWVVFVPAHILKASSTAEGHCMAVLPCHADALFGHAVAEHSRREQSEWIAQARALAETLDIGRSHPMLLGVLQLTGRDRVAIVAVLTRRVAEPSACCLSSQQWKAAVSEKNSHDSRMQAYLWCATAAVQEPATAKILGVVERRLRALTKPTETTAMTDWLQTGVGAARRVRTTVVADQMPETDACMHLAQCAQLEADLPDALTAVDRGDAAYAEYARRCATRVDPLPLKDIPEALLKCAAALPTLKELEAKPYVHGARIPSTRPLQRKSPPQPTWMTIPTCDEEVFTKEFLAASDAQFKMITKWHRGQALRRPKPLFAGLEAVQPHLRDWFAAGGSLKCDGVGRYSILQDCEPYPTHWNKSWLKELLSTSNDQQLAGENGLWLGGIDLLDESPFLMGICGNLVSAYGLEKMGPTNSQRAQEVSDKLAIELEQFVKGSPQLYQEPVPVEDCRGVRSCRFTTIPWCNDPHGQVPKKGGDIRVIINMSHPEKGGFTMAGEEVISKNVRAQIHPPEGVLQRDWKHPGEPKPTVGMRAENDAILAALGREIGVAVAKISIDGWKMFHQFFYATSQLCKTGALIPLAESLEPSKKRLGVTHALVMAMGAAPASANCQRAMNELMRAYRAKFRQLDEPYLRDEPAAVQRFLEARRGMQDDFGPMDSLTTGVVYTDDSDITVLGPAARVERANYAVYCSFGDGGAGMILADALKWLISSHSLWCGVYSAPTLGIVWFDTSKRMKAITRIQQGLAGHLDVDQYRSLVSYLAYVNSVIHEHPYMVATLWRPLTEERLEQAEGKISLTSEEPGKLKFWRKRMTQCPGTTLTRHLQKLKPPRLVGEVQWTSTSDAMLGWDVAEERWQCGLGGAVHNVMWSLQLEPETWQSVVTTPMAEFMACGIGLMVLTHVLPDATNVLLEVDAWATQIALANKADAPRLRAAHEVLLETSSWKRLEHHLNIKHVWGHGNALADACSRQERQRAEDICEALGMEPRWQREVPPEAQQYLEVVRLRVIALGLPPPDTADLRKRRARNAYDLKEPGATAIRFVPFVPPKTPQLKKEVDDSTVSLRWQARFVPSTPRPVNKETLQQSTPRQEEAREDKYPVIELGRQRGCTQYREGDASSLNNSSKVRFIHLMTVAAGAGHESGMENVRLDRLAPILIDYLKAAELAAPRSTVDGEGSAWNRWWAPYCKWLQIEPIRANMEAHSGKDADKYNVEVAILAGALPWIMARMQPGKGKGRAAALPTSGLKVLYHVRRYHLRRLLYPHFVPLIAVVQACDGMCREYVEVHGPEALLPHRKEPLTNPMVESMLDLYQTGKIIGKRVVDMTSVGWLCLSAMFHTLAQTGFRKAEVAMAAGIKWNKACASMANLAWMIGGRCYPELSHSLFEQMQREGGFALLRPPPSKSDRLGLHWGPCTIYLRYYEEVHICAARALALMELGRKVPVSRGENAPLFVNFEGSVWRHEPLTQIFADMLTQIGVERAMIRNYSMHSWRIYLACALLAANASHATIQAMLRWRSEEALRIYARINSETYADRLAEAGQASISSIRTTSLAACMQQASAVGGPVEAQFHDAWLQAAAQQRFETSVATNLPVHTEDEIISQIRDARLHTEMQNLLRAEADADE